MGMGAGKIPPVATLAYDPGGTDVISNPNNAYPRELFGGNGILVPMGGTWEIEVTLGVSRAGGVGGTALSQSIVLAFTADGLALSPVASNAGEPPADGFTRPYQLRAIRALTAGQLISVQWGFGLVQAAALTARNRVLTLRPVTP